MSSRLLNAAIALLTLLPTASAAAPAAACPLTSLHGKVFLTVPEALELAFPGAKVERTTAYLSDDDKQAIGRLAKLEFESGIVFPYRASKDGKLVGTAYFDTHRVRTLRETVMVVVLPSGVVGRVELLSFAEPRDYIPRAKWYRQFDGKVLSEKLNLKRDIKAVTGATLTARATTAATRRVLALHTFLDRQRPKKRVSQAHESKA